MQITINIPDLQLLVLQMLKAVSEATVDVLEPTPRLSKRDVSGFFGAIKPQMSESEIETRLQNEKDEWL